MERSEGYAFLASEYVHHLEQAVYYVLFVLPVVILAQLQGKQHVFRHGKRIEQRAGLKHHRHFAADAAEFRLRHIGDIFVGDDYAALVGLEKAHDVRERHRFPDAAAADDRHRLARIYVKIGIDQNGLVERLIHVPELDVMWIGIILRHRPPNPPGC